ncbi:MAG TPA: hypothetical protein VIF63_05110 [Candidatus Limnocylindrales bacterium]
MDDPGDPAQSTPTGNPSTSPHLADPRALTILTTEHWNLLTARSLVYNEAFARSGMFLSFLSASLVVLGLISAATGFSDAFLTVAAAFLALDLFIGFATLGRIVAASDEDLRYLQGMNRLRHAYLEMVPGVERYFITSQYDDFGSVAAFYGPTGSGVIRGVLHGFTTAPGMIGVICAAVAGGLGAAVALLMTHDAMVGGAAGVIAFIVVFAGGSSAVVWQVGGVMRRMDVMFPAPPDAVRKEPNKALGRRPD